MKLRKSHPKSDVDVLLRSGRSIAPIPGNVRARVLARARATAQASPMQRLHTPPVTSRRGSTIALAAAVAFIVGAAGAAVAMRARLRDESHLAQPARPHGEAAACATATPVAAPPAPEATPPSNVETKPTRAEPSISPRESYTAELGLLQRAQAAYADRNFATTLLLVGEHARHFPNGRLAEEREALRVRALMGAGREAEARKAASAFKARFPRSALLPRSGLESSSGN